MIRNYHHYYPTTLTHYHTTTITTLHYPTTLHLHYTPTTMLPHYFTTTKLTHVTTQPAPNYHTKLHHHHSTTSTTLHPYHTTTKPPPRTGPLVAEQQVTPGRHRYHSPNIITIGHRVPQYGRQINRPIVIVNRMVQWAYHVHFR